MENKFTSAYTYFDDLATSSDFLNFLINNISSSVLILNKDLELQAFNEPLKSMFVNRKDEHLLYQRCGEAIGCAYQVDEAVQCGETTHCKACSMRIDALEAYSTRKPIFRKSLIREFYKIDGSKEKKSLHYTIKPFYFKGNYYLMVLVEAAKTWTSRLINNIDLPSETFYS